MNILISKLDVCKFNNSIEKSISYGGFDVAAFLIMNLVKLYPQHTFYYIGSNDIQDLKDCPNNLIDIEMPIRKLRQQLKSKEKYEAAVEYCRQLKFDIAIYWYCRYTTVINYKDDYVSPKTNERLSIRVCEQAFSHIMAVPKAYSIPVYYLIDDPMELNRLPFDMQMPKSIWSQFSGSITCGYYNDNDHVNRIKITLPVIYKPIERLWLANKTKIDWRNFTKTNRFIITCNGPSNNRLTKLFYINDWVIKNFDDAIIYGKWLMPKALTNAIDKLGISDRFVDKPMCTMEDVMFNTKYTFVIPPSNKYPEFVTQKVFSMLYYGIIPFWCKRDYDCKNEIYKNFPDYIKVESAEELKFKMNELDSNDIMYRNLLNDLYGLLDDSYFDCRIIHNIFDEILL